MSQDEGRQGSFSLGGKGQINIGEMFVRAGMIPGEVLNDAMRQCGNNPHRVGEALLAMNYINKRQLELATEAYNLVSQGLVDMYPAVLAIRTADRGNITLADALTRAGVNLPTGMSKPTSNAGQLADFLLDAGIIHGEHIEKATLKSKQTRMPLGRSLVSLGYLPESLLDAALNAQELIRDGRLDRQAAVKALSIAKKQQMVIDMGERRKAQRANLKIADIVSLAGMATESDVRNAQEFALEQNKDVGTMLVLGGLISQESLSATIELWQAVKNGNCSLEDACQELKEVHAAFPVSRDSLASVQALANAPAQPPQPVQQPQAPEPPPPPAPVQSSNPFGNIVMPTSDASRGVIQLGGAPSSSPITPAAPSAPITSPAPPQEPIAPPAPPSPAAPGEMQSRVPGILAQQSAQSGSYAAASGIGGGGAPGSPNIGASNQPGAFPKTPVLRGEGNEAVADAMSQMFRGLSMTGFELQNLQDRWKHEEDERKRFQEQVAEAARATAAETSAVTAIRSQEATKSDTEFQNAQEEEALAAQKKKKYMIMGGAAAAAIIGIIAIMAMLSPGGPSIANNVESAKGHLKQGMLEVAREEIQLAVSKKPNDAEALHIFAEILYKQSNYPECLQRYEEAEKNGAKLTEGDLEKMAYAAVRTKQWDKARLITEKQIAMKSTPPLLVQLARIERDSNNPEMAIAHFDQAISQGSTAVFRERGELHLQLKHGKKALADFDSAIKQNDKDMRAHFLRGRAYLMNGDASSALTDFKAAVSPDKPDPQVLAFKAAAHNMLGEYSEALDAANEALQIDQNSVPALLARGDAFMGRGAFRRADTDYDAVLHLDPNNTDAQEKKRKAYVGYMRASDGDSNPSPADSPATDEKKEEPKPEEKKP